ncbi:MAG: DUF362 domain-containing protein [Oscillospiraceae bacterium]|nr:DUF362 domain-containing protein [Oscillospiraceae bacterium]
MTVSKVYFTDFHISDRENRIQKLKRLILTAGMDQIDFQNQFVAIKIHFGELGNLSFLRPNYAKAVADVVKELGGRPFLTDCNTLYVGSRKNALDHLDTAYENGFSQSSTGCHVLIADGLKGSNETLVPVDGEYVKEAKIGSAIMDADIVISLTHFKGHEMTGMGGAMKNLGMGSGSRAGKMEMHSAGKPYVDQGRCIGCGSCQRICAHSAPEMRNKKVTINHSKCVGCGRCIAVCPMDAVQPAQDEALENLNCKIAEYAKAVVQNRPAFHISLAMEISPDCDCHNSNDIPIVPDVGMFASFDPVAIDQACCDAVNRQIPQKGSTIEGKEGEPLSAAHPITDWRGQIVHGKKIGLGTDEYELVRI